MSSKPKNDDQPTKWPVNIETVLVVANAAALVNALTVVARRYGSEELWTPIEIITSIVIVIVALVSVIAQCAFSWPGMSAAQQGQTQLLLVACTVIVSVCSAVMQHLERNDAPAESLPATTPQGLSTV
jgi:cytochrome c biogenesis factor